MIPYLLAGILTGLAFACFILPAFVALAGPDEERMSREWLERERGSR